MLGHLIPCNRFFLFESRLSSLVFAKEQVGSIVFLFAYIGLVTGNQAEGEIFGGEKEVLYLSYIFMIRDWF